MYSTERKCQARMQKKQKALSMEFFRKKKCYRGRNAEELQNSCSFLWRFSKGTNMGEREHEQRKGKKILIIQGIRKQKRGELLCQPRI